MAHTKKRRDLENETRKNRQQTTSLYDAHFTNEIIKSCRQNDTMEKKQCEEHENTRSDRHKYLSINKSELIQFSCAPPPPPPLPLSHPFNRFVKVLSILFIWLNVSNKVCLWLFWLCLALKLWARTWQIFFNRNMFTRIFWFLIVKFGAFKWIK